MTAETFLRGSISALINRPKHLITFFGGHHFDYVDVPAGTSGFTPGDVPKGPCTLTPAITADLLTSFFADYMDPAIDATPSIPDTLLPQPFTQTTKQSFYAGGFFTALPSLKQGGKKGPCSLEHYWETGNTVKPTGTLYLGS